MLDIPSNSRSDLNTLDPKRITEHLGRSQSVRRTSNSQNTEGLFRNSSLRLSAASKSPDNGGLRRMSKFLHESLLGGEMVKQEFKKLYDLHELTIMEYKRLKHHIDTLAKDYNYLQTSNNWLSRYRLLKSMIKRCVMHLKVGEDTQVMSAGVAKEINRKCEEKYEKLNTETLNEEETMLKSQITLHQARIAILREVFKDLDTQYSASKKYVALTRYQMLNALIKDLLARPNVKDLLL